MKNNYRGLWIGKTGDANSWYHIFPFATLSTHILNVVRHSPPKREIPNTRYHTFKQRNIFLDSITIIFISFRVLLNNKVDYIVSFNPIPWASIAWFLAKIFNKKIIIGFIGTDFNYYYKKSRLRGLIKFIIKRSDAVTTTGDNMSKDLMKQGINNVHTFPHCVSDKWCNDTPFLEKKYDLITVAPILKPKRIHDIIKSIKQMREKQIHMKLCIVGDGPELGNLRKYVSDNSLDKQVDIIGYTDDVRPYLRKSKIFVQASENEGFSLSLVEAIMMDLVPILTNAGSEKDIIIDKVHGLYFPIGNIDSLINNIIYLQDKVNYDSMINNLKDIKTHFSEMHAKQKVLGLINSLYN